MDIEDRTAGWAGALHDTKQKIISCIWQPLTAFHFGLVFINEKKTEPERDDQWSPRKTSFTS